jgi:hypothetical protein
MVRHGAHGAAESSSRRSGHLTTGLHCVLGALLVPWVGSWQLWRTACGYAHLDGHTWAFASA